VQKNDADGLEKAISIKEPPEAVGCRVLSLLVNSEAPMVRDAARKLLGQQEQIGVKRVRGAIAALVNAPTRR
jgi:hypothetical protein